MSTELVSAFRNIVRTSVGLFYIKQITKIYRDIKTIVWDYKLITEMFYKHFMHSKSFVLLTVMKLSYRKYIINIPANKFEDFALRSLRFIK